MGKIPFSLAPSLFNVTSQVTTVHGLGGANEPLLSSTLFDVNRGCLRLALI